MMIDAHIADGRTTFRFKSRGQFIDLIGRNLGKFGEFDTVQGVKCWVRWHREDDFVPCKLHSIRAGSVAFTRAVEGQERADFETRFPSPEVRP